MSSNSKKSKPEKKPENENKNEVKNKNEPSEDIDNKKEVLYAEINHKYFTESLFNLLDLIEAKSKETIEVLKQNYEKDAQTEPDIKKTPKYINHTQLQSQCQAVRNGFSGKTKGFDQGKVIKKVYKVLTQHIDKFFPERDLSLFQLKDNEGVSTTIIPGIVINLIVKSKQTTQDEMEKIWGYLYLMYIAATNLINYVNENKKDEKIVELTIKMREKVVEMGIIKEYEFVNPFIGLNVKTGEFNVKDLFDNIDANGDQSDMTSDMSSSVLKMSGMDKMFDMKELSKQLKDIKEDDINEATEKITNLIGAKGDSDVSEICGELVKNVVNDLQNDTSGNLNMFGIAQSVAQRVGGNMKNKDKFNKAATQVNKFMNNSENMLKDLKDDKGNPIGEKLMKTLNISQILGDMGKTMPKKK
jgi:hypothetical protein